MRGSERSRGWALFDTLVGLVGYTASAVLLIIGTGLLVWTFLDPKTFDLFVTRGVASLAIVGSLFIGYGTRLIKKAVK